MANAFSNCTCTIRNVSRKLILGLGILDLGDFGFGGFEFGGFWISRVLDFEGFGFGGFPVEFWHKYFNAVLGYFKIGGVEPG